MRPVTVKASGETVEILALGASLECGGLAPHSKEASFPGFRESGRSAINCVNSATPQKVATLNSFVHFVRLCGSM